MRWLGSALLALAGLACSAPVGSSSPVPPYVGTFSAESESEWTLDLTLNPDGSAAIELSSWGGADDYSVTKHETIRATWLLGPNGDLLVTYRGTTDVLRYFPELSRAELGETGSAPGLKAVSPPGAESAIGTNSLWRSDRTE